MSRAAVVVMIVSLSIGSAAPLLCEFSCLSHDSARLPKTCHDHTSALTMIDGSAACSHDAPDATAIVAAKTEVPPQATFAMLGIPTVLSVAPGSRELQAGGPPGSVIHPRSASRSILRI